MSRNLPQQFAKSTSISGGGTGGSSRQGAPRGGGQSGHGAPRGGGYGASRPDGASRGGGASRPTGQNSSNRSAVAHSTGPVAGRSNAYQFVIKPGSTVYRYDVEIMKMGDKRQKSLTRQGDISIRTAQREACGDIMEAFHAMTNGFGSGAKYVYDGRMILFSTQKINLPKETTSLTADKLKQETAKFLRGDPVDITITPNQEYFQLDYSNLESCLVGDVREQADRSVRTFLEMVTSQSLINDRKYQIIGAGTLFENETRPLVDGMDLRVGLKKGARVTKHSDKPKAFIFLDMKRTAFFSTQPMSVLFKAMVRGDRDRANFARFFREVRMVVSYDTSRTFLFGSLTDFAISHKDYIVNGKTVPQYLKERHNVTLKELNMPGCHPDQPNGRQIVYPLEVIYPLPGQVIPLDKLNDQAIRRLLLENSIQPHERYAFSSQQIRMISENAGAEFLQQFGLSIDLQSNHAQIIPNRFPQIKTGDDRPITPQVNGSWMRDAVGAKFLVGTAMLKKWIVAFDERASAVSFVEKYVQGLCVLAKQSGMALPAPLDYVPTDLNRMEDIFKRAKENKLQFIFYLDEQHVKSHGRLKLFEAYYKILTQQVITKNMQNGLQTFKNVLMKTNVKAFGINYIPIMDSPALKNLKLDSSDLLIIGYDIAPPEKTSPKEMADHVRKNYPGQKGDVPKIKNLHPAVVGIVANKGKEPYAFSGDFFYQEANGGLIDGEKLSEAVANVVSDACRHRKPLRLIVLRDGISEGEQSNAVTNELAAIRKGYLAGVKRTQPNANLKPTITFVVGTKNHDKRAYRTAGQSVTNTMAGDVIKSQVARTDITEIYLQSHHPLKGVPKICQYDVLVDENGLAEKQLEELFLALSSMHQVCACPTSLPLPIYMADENTKRGQDIYKALRAYRSTREGANFAPEIKMEKGIYDVRSLNSTLQYFGHKLYETRFNA